MASWLNWGLVYCVICWLASLAIVAAGRRWWAEEGDECPSFDALLRQYGLRARLAMTAAVLFLGPLLPLIALYCSIGMLREHMFWANLARTHREYVFERMHPANLPRPARRYVEEHKPALLDLGFTELGTYLLKPEPVTIHGSCLRSRHGETIGELLFILQETAFSFNTVFEDGMVLETSSVEPVDDLERLTETGKYYCHFVPGCSPAEGYRRHLELAAEIEGDTGCRPMAFHPEQLKEVLTYGNRRFGHVSFELGQMNEPPPAACPAGTPISCEELLDGQRLPAVSSA